MNHRNLCKIAALLMEMRGGWYKVKSKSDKPDETTMVIYDVIGDSLGADDFSTNKFLKELDEIDSKVIKVLIDSPGGDAFAGSRIFNRLLEKNAHIITIVDGEAASAAASIFMAGDDRVMGLGTSFMIHNPWNIAKGDHRDMENSAKSLRNTRDSIAGLLSDRSMQKTSLIQEMMDAETWMTPEQALDLNFATEKIQTSDSTDDAIKNHKPSLLWRVIASQYKNSNGDEVTPEEWEFLHREISKPNQQNFQVLKLEGNQPMAMSFLEKPLQAKYTPVDWKPDGDTYRDKYFGTVQPDKSTPNQLKEIRWQDANANTNTLPSGSGHLDFNLRVNNQVYPTTKGRFLMLQQFVDASDFDGPEKALEQFKALKLNASDQSTELVELKTKFNTLEQTVKAKDSVIEGVQLKQFKGELNDRTSRIEALVKSCRIEPAEAEPLNKAFMEIDPKLVPDTQKDADFALNFLESSKPREDLLELEGLTGVDGEGKNKKDVSIEQQLVDIAKAKQVEKPEMSWGDAFRLAKEENPELLK